MLKKLLSTFILLFLFVNLSSCQKEDTLTGYTFTDDLGRAVTVNAPTRVAALLGSYADMWLLAGGDVCATAEDAWSDFNLQLSEDTVNLGTTHSPSLEQIFLSEPQFVIASSKSSKHLEMEEPLEAAGMAVAYFDVCDFSSFCRVLKIFTDITERADLYEKYGEGQKAVIDGIIMRNQEKSPQTVLVLRASATSIKAKNSEGTMLGGMLKDFGCINIADGDNMLLENLSIESITIKNPDKIFIVEMGDKTEEMKANVEALFSQNPLWGELDAVKNGNVYFMDKHLYNIKPNARFSQAYENLEKILYGAD